ncbi:hypothetical protein [Mediterraneibacter massiliensis]|uniref:hypothetical protein n=1 Tax=Mediterraneibacter massiliensis TaxID=1720300 RepID=UPI00073ECAA4|nr:hypothetical protein [Mediterraneibacter massiliensis]
MKIIFNDATELQVQQAVLHGDYLLFKTVSATPEELRKIFEDPVKTKKMTVEERGQTVAVYEGYMTFYSTTEYIGQIYGVTMYKPGETPEERLEEIETDVEQTNADLQMAIAELTMLIATMQGGGAGV